MAILSRKASRALKSLNLTEYKIRAGKLERSGEYGFALILYWNQIESALKLMKYYQNIKNDWPDRLNFIRKDWGPLKELYKDNKIYYECLFSGKNNSICAIRNFIVHEGWNITNDEFQYFLVVMRWAIQKLLLIVPNEERFRDKKRRSNIQLGRG